MAKGSGRNQQADGAGRPGPDWVTLREAAREAGVSVSTLRNWYRKGLIESRAAEGSNGPQKMVRRLEVLERANKGGSRPRGAGDPPPEQVPGPGPNGAAPRRAPGRGDLVAVTRALPELIRELADARERAGRAEAKAEFLAEQIAELRARPDDGAARAAALEEENRLLRRRLQYVQVEIEALSSAAEADEDPSDALTPEEEDELLSRTQRRRARRRRKKQARLSPRAETSSGQAPPP